MWAAAIAIEGSPEAAIDTDRIFSSNFLHVPVLWVGNGPDDQALAAKLKGGGLNLEWRAADKSFTDAALLAWLGEHKREEFPTEIDCETNSPAFAGCYWIRMTKFDAGERNDVLPSTRIPAAAGAALDLGGFGFKMTEPGPGVLVSMLPPKYSGPLKTGDRIVALDGRPVVDARQYVQTMAKFTESRPIVATVRARQGSRSDRNERGAAAAGAGGDGPCARAVPAGRKPDPDRQPLGHGNENYGASRVGAGRPAFLERADAG